MAFTSNEEKGKGKGQGAWKWNLTNLCVPESAVQYWMGAKPKTNHASNSEAGSDGPQKCTRAQENVVLRLHPMEVEPEQVIQCAIQAGEKILEVYNKPQEEWDIQLKEDSSPVTEADEKANAIICDRLRELSPHIPIVSEENEKVPYSTRQAYQYSWCVDPLDGTKEFIKRNGQFTVNIALLCGSKPILGVVYIPCTKEMYWAVEGRGAYVRREGEQEVQIQCEEFNVNDSGLTIICSSRHKSPETEEIISQYTDPKFSEMGSSIKFMRLAEGKAHVYPRMAPTCEWDTAASQIIVTEAGGEVLKAGLCSNDGTLLEDWKKALAKNEPVEYNKENSLNPFFVAYAKRKQVITQPPTVQ